MDEPFSSASSARPWTVSTLLLAVSDALSARFAALAVRGELSGFTRAASGHLYFSLKDADGAAATIRCAMFRRAASMLDFKPADGQRVDVRGRLAVYEPRGELQFIVESLQRVGAGTLYEEFLRLRARLAAEGLFDPARRRPLPTHPRAIGVVTSRAGAALHDVLTTLARRAPHVPVVVYPSLVQGADAPPALLSALGQASARAEVDTLLLVRGGGSLEDLWAFNDERVVRAVAACRVPVVCGVGHETDVTLCDLAADLRAATPTAAAELAAPVRAELAGRLDVLAGGLHQAVGRRVDREWQRLDLIAHRSGKPAALLAGQAHRLDGLQLRLAGARQARTATAAQTLELHATRLKRAGAALLDRRAERLVVLADRLTASHPQQVLRRGYAWVQGPTGRPVMSASSLQPGDAVEAVFGDGRAAAQITAVTHLPPEH